MKSLELSLMTFITALKNIQSCIKNTVICQSAGICFLIYLIRALKAAERVGLIIRIENAATVLIPLWRERWDLGIVLLYFIYSKYQCYAYQCTYLVKYFS